MERRKFIGTIGLAGIFATGVAPAVQAAQATRWRLVSRFPKTMDVAHGGMQNFAQLVMDLSSGKFEISIISSDELTNGNSVLESVQRGSVECGHTSASYYVGKDETFAFDSAIPFGLNARQMNAWMQHGNGLTLLRDFYNAQGIVNFPMGNTGAQMGGWYRKPLKSVADLKGMRMRILGLGGRVLERLGAKPSSQSSGETLQALGRGNLDAAEWSSPHDDLKLGLHNACPHYAFPGWWKGSSQFSLYINKRAFETLTEENQAIVEAAAAATHLFIQAQYDAQNAFALEQLAATGVHLQPMPRAILDAAWGATQDLYAELAEKNPYWRKVHTSYAAFLHKMVLGWGRTEASFDNHMHEQITKVVDAKRKKKKSAPTTRR